MKRNIILLAVLIQLVTSAVTAQQCSREWTSRGDSCYKWFSHPQYWNDAEQICRSLQGHLVSIQSQHENTLVARLAHCKSAWIGRFGTNLNKLNDSSSYVWTDGSDPVSFDRHNFTQLDSVQKSLIRSDGEWWINSLNDERHPFVCERNTQDNKTRSCPNGWSLYHNHCYLMPDFESNFIEANFYCQGKSSQLVSVLNQPELNNIKKLIFGIDSCGPNPIDTVWLGLIKLNSCFPDSGGRELCYQWTDFSGKHVGFPTWQLGHPKSSDWTVNCVTLRGDRLYSEACHNRHRFVCKSPADGVVAAFDFRNGLENLVDPNTYKVREYYNVPRSADKGACFSNDNYYTVGNVVHYNNTFLNNPEWTVFFRARKEDSRSATLLSIRSGISPIINKDYLRMQLLDSNKFYASEYQYNGKNITRFYHEHHYDLDNSTCPVSGCTYVIGSSNYRYSFTRNERPMEGSYSRKLRSVDWLPDLYSITIGQSVWGSIEAKFCISCFGIANRKLDSQDIRKVLNTYC